MNVALAYVNQGYTGEKPTAAAREHGIELEVVELPDAKRDFVLLPRPWMIERTFAWRRASADLCVITSVSFKLWQICTPARWSV